MGDSRVKLTNSNLYIYGTGTFGKRIVNNLESLGLQVNGFLDFNPQFSENIELVTIEYIKSIPNSVVILALGNGYADIRSVCKTLEDSGIDYITPVAIARFFHESGLSLNNYWLSGDPNTIISNSKNLDVFRKQLIDETSKFLLDKTIQYRLDGNAFSLGDHQSPELCYLPIDFTWLPKNQPLLNVIDGGAHIGDTLKAFIDSEKNIVSWHCFEPEEQNFEKLNENCLFFGSKFEITTNKLALWDISTTLNFVVSGNDNTGAHISDSNSGNLINTVSIDEFLNGRNCSLIKLDIEGAESEALNGAIDTLRTWKPNLAISLYHKPEHIWEIPEYIMNLDLGYEFRIRTYCEQTFENVLYCSLPKF